MNGASWTLAAAGLLALAGAARRGARAMKTPRDLGPGMRVVVGDVCDRAEDVEIGLIQEHECLGAIRFFNYFTGEVYSDRKAKPGKAIWSVCEVEAEHGYGPMLYDLALECVHLAGGRGLIPDRAQVSDEAGEVWNRYLTTRHDVEHEPIPQAVLHSREYSNEANLHTEYPGFRPELDHIYSKTHAPTIYHLLQLGKLDFGNLEPSNLRTALEMLEKKALAQGSRAVSPADLGYSRKEISLAERALEHTPSGASAGPSEADLVGKVYPKAWFVPPARVRRAARLGLKLRKQLEATHRVASDGSGPGGTWIGVGRALQLATHDVVPPRDLRRIVSYSERHAVDRKAPGFGDTRKPTKGFIAELLWGNDAAEQGAKAWAEGVLKKMQEHDLRHGGRHGRK